MTLDEAIMELQMLRKELGKDVKIVFRDIGGERHDISHCQRFVQPYVCDVVIMREV